MRDGLLNLEDACKYLKKCARTVTKYCDDGILPCGRLGDIYVFSPIALHLFAMGFTKEEIEAKMFEYLSNKYEKQQTEMNKWAS